MGVTTTDRGIVGIDRLLGSNMVWKGKKKCECTEEGERHVVALMGQRGGSNIDLPCMQ